MHLPLEVKPTALDSQTLPGGGKIRLDLEAGTLVHLRTGGAAEVFPIAEHTQRSLFEALLGSLRRDGLGGELGVGEADSPAEGLVNRLVAGGKAGASLRLDALTRDEPLVLAPGTARAFAEVLYSVFTALARFRARLEGAMTPLIVWPEHFDLSTLWFHPSNRELDEHGPHMSFGLAPFTPGQYELPYLYAYAYPYPEGFRPPSLPEPAAWHDEGWRGAVVTYQALSEAADHEAFVEEMSRALFRALSGVLAS